MGSVIDRLTLPRGEEVFSEGGWRTFLDQVRAYGENVEQEVRSLEENKELLLGIINLIPVAFFVKDHESRFFLMNRACEEQWGLSFAALRGTDASQFFPTDQMKQFLAKDRAIFEGRHAVEFEETFWSAAKQENRDGYTFKLPMYDAQGNAQYLVCVTLDITDRKLAQAALLDSEKKLLAMATTDFLTGLPNRRQFVSRLTDEFVRMERFDDHCCSVLMLDIDFADLLRDTVRKIDTAARVGGEEFAIILPGIDSTAASRVAGRLHKLLAQAPFVQAGNTICVTVSIGIATMDRRDASADDTLIRADRALYRAKNNGRNRVELTEFKIAV
jgi:PAS domain S-box-containing protein